MELFHTSAEKIKAISDAGRFGEFLFFSTGVYVMTAGDFVTYAIEIDEAEIIDAGSLFYHEGAAKLDALVQRVVRRFGVDEDTAEELISGRIAAHEIDSIDADDLADAEWDIQHAAAQAAKILGFRGVRVQDEQGSAYMIDMLGRESDLTLVSE